jgi:hypothetical protein
MTIEDAVHAHVDFAAALHNDEMVAQYNDRERDSIRWFRRYVMDCPTAEVSPDLTGLIAGVYPDFDVEWTPRPEDFVSKGCYVHFGRPLPLFRDIALANGGIVHTELLGFCWVSAIGSTDGDGPAALVVPDVRVRHDGQQYQSQARVFMQPHALQFSKPLRELFPDDHEWWLKRAGDDVLAADSDELAAQDDVLIASSTVMLMGQRLTRVADVRPSRQVGRWHARRSEDPSYKLVTLRAVDYKDTGEPSEAGRQLVSRHIRRGHWHTVLHGPGKIYRRPQWYAPTVVGPAGTPLKVDTRTVFDVRR